MIFFLIFKLLSYKIIPFQISTLWVLALHKAYLPNVSFKFSSVFLYFWTYQFSEKISNFILQFGYLVICPTKKKIYHKLTENVHYLFLIFCLLQGEIVVLRHESKFVLKSVQMDILKMQWHVRESKTWFNNSLSWNLR